MIQELICMDYCSRYKTSKTIEHKNLYIKDREYILLQFELKALDIQRLTCSDETSRFKSVRRVQSQTNKTTTRGNKL